jgi:hypothetical protein
MALLEVENSNEDLVLQFRMQGPIFDNGIPVPIMINALGHVQGIIDKAYLGFTDRKRLTKEERARFFLRTPQVRNSSLLTDLGLAFTGLQPTIPIVAVLGPTGIWEHAKATFEFLKLVFEAAKINLPISYSYNADRSIMHVNTGTQTQAFNAPVFNIAQMSINHYQGLTQHLQPDHVTGIEYGRHSQREIELSLPDRNLFEFPSRVEDTPVQIRCEVFDFNKFENIGRLHVFSGEGVPEGDYRFQVIGKQDVSAFIEAMLRQAVSVTCLREVSENPVSGERTTRLQIINIET